MRSPKDMRIIQIDVTNACVHQCSNCTRFCGHHQKPFFMDWETFKKSVDSLGGFERCVGIMGGEPTLHPQFELFVKYASEKHGSLYKIDPMKKPVLNFQQYMRDRNYFLDETLNDRNGLGLWTSACNSYYKHFELIQDTFSYQTINDHNNPSLHQPLLTSRKELNISDGEWIPMRDNCWFQNMWSASITPKGAFFCEVAGALDMLFDGPGGWPIEPGWWKREPKDFGYQLSWCEICGGALFSSGRLSSEEIDDVSPLLYEKLKQVNSPKVKNNRVVIMDMDNPQPGMEMPNTRDRYLTDYNKRISQANRSLFPKIIDGIIFFECDEDIEKINVRHLSKNFDTIILFASNEVLSKKLKNISFEEKNITVIDSQLNSFGRTLNKSIKASGNDWICFIDGNSYIDHDFTERLKKVVLNPGVLYTLLGKNQCALFNSNANSLKKACYDGISECNSKDSFFLLWDENKSVILDQTFDTNNNPDIDYWYAYANTSQLQNKTIYKVLEKIRSDYGSSKEVNNGK